MQGRGKSKQFTNNSSTTQNLLSCLVVKIEKQTEEIF
jgi:hypothetical protein